MTPVFPHPVLADRPVVRVQQLRLDGQSRPDRLESHLQRIDLAGLDSLGGIEVDCSLTVASEDADRLPSKVGDLRATVTAYCAATLLRQSITMTADPLRRGAWSATVPLDGDELHGKVELVGQVTADVGDRPARRLGTADVWSLYVDEAARPPFHGTFSVRWSHFAGASREVGVPEAAAAESFFVDLAATVPTIHLNRDMDGLFELLTGDAPAEKLERALRDAEMRRIVASAWTSAIGVGAASIKVDPDTLEHELPDGWRGDVLRWALPFIYPDVPTETAAKRLREDLSSPEQAPVTQGMIQLAVSRHMKAGELLKRALKETGA